MRSARMRNDSAATAAQTPGSTRRSTRMPYWMTTMTEFPMVACITCGKPVPYGRSRCPAHTPKSSSGWAKYALAHPREAAYYSTEHWRVTRREVLERDRDCKLRLQG